MNVLHLPVALAKYPERGVVGLSRVSTPQQAGLKKEGRPLLMAKTEALMRELDELVGDRLWNEPFTEIGYGKFSNRRPDFDAWIQFCLDNNCIGVAVNLSRLFRPEAFDQKANINALPTAEDWKNFVERKRGVVIATIQDPNATESERQSRLTKRTGKAGRPSEIKGKEEAILKYHRRGESLRKLEARCGIGKDAIGRFLKTPVPPELVKGEQGLTLGTVNNPGEIFGKMWEIAVAKR